MDMVGKQIEMQMEDAKIIDQNGGVNYLNCLDKYGNKTKEI